MNKSLAMVLVVVVVMMVVVAALVNGQPPKEICNEQMLKDARLASKSSRGWFVQKKVVLPQGVCEAYIDVNVEGRAFSMEPDLKHFTTIVTPVYDEVKFSEYSRPVKRLENITEVYNFIMDDTFFIPTERPYGTRQSITKDKVDDYLGRLAQSAGMSFEEFINDIRSFEAVFYRLLVKPCKQFETTFGVLFDGAKVMASIRGKFDYSSRRTPQFRELAYTRKVCEAVELLNQNNDNTYKQLGFNKQDMFKSFAKNPIRYWDIYTHDPKHSK